MTLPRQTLRQTAEFEGWGLHSGVAVRVRMHPSESGIVFRCGSDWVEARPENVTDTDRCTRLGPIGTIEHLMAALAGLEVTDVEVELTAPELPALDGSAGPYVEGILRAGLETMAEWEPAAPFSRVFLHEGERKLSISAGEGHWRYEYRCAGWPHEQVFESADVVRDFPTEVAPARTFGDAAQAPALQAAGYARGLDLSSALLIGEAGYANAARFDDEPARHKLLDAMGDLYLAGIPIRLLNLVAQGTGHRMNVAAAQMLRAGQSS